MAYYDDYYTPYQPVLTPLTPTAAARPKRQMSVQQRMPLLLVCAILVSAVLFGRLLPALFAGTLTTTPVEAAVVPEQVAEETQAAGVGSGAPETVAPVPAGQGVLAPVFTREVLHWEPQIVGWAADYGLDPNLVAIIMQIESCGDPGAASGAGAQGLFQVMPFHFAAGEDMLDPDTNARRGMTYFVERLAQTGGDIGRSFAGYNGGHVAAGSSWDNWAHETQRYYQWSTGIYSDIQNGLSESPTVSQWLAAGGASLCNQAANRLGLP